MSAKSAAAFRTIGEVADELDVPPHVLRFWETKFPDIRPLKRGGGRRYYRPEDVQLLHRIRQLLYEDGLTIRGAQQWLRRSAPTTPAPLASRGEELPVSAEADAWRDADGPGPAEPEGEDSETEGEDSEAEAQAYRYRSELEYLLEELKDLRATLTIARPR